MAVGDGWDFSISFPDRWFVRDNDLATRRRTTEEAVEAYLGERSDVSVDPRWMVEMLLGLAADADDKGALIAANLWDMADGIVVMANLMVFEGDRQAPESVDAELANLVDALSRPDTGDVGEREPTVVHLPAGRAAYLRMLAESGADERGDTLLLDTVQYWLPVPDRRDCVFISGSTPNVALGDAFADECRWIADTVELMLE